MEFELLGSPPQAPTLDLDHERFAYAGKFVMSDSGKTVARDDGTLVGAVAFSEDRSDSAAVRLRYVTVRRDRHGEGIGSRLLRFTAALLADDYERVLIAANNPIAYRACYRAGFVFTGRETGLAELVLAYNPTVERTRDRYCEGLDVFRDRDLPEKHLAVLEQREPPSVVDAPAGDS
jgi:GNAT superfamily N-acetyltransferase